MSSALSLKQYFNAIIRDSEESLCIYLPTVDCRLYFGTTQQAAMLQQTYPVTLLLHNPITFCFRILLNPKIGLGEAYMSEDWDVQPKIHDFLGLLIRAKRKNATKNLEKFHSFSLKTLLSLLIRSFVHVIQTAVSFMDALRHRWNGNSLTGSARNIRDHYDLGNDMFSIFLDESMTYSCAIFQSIPEKITHFDRKLLEEAQMRKYDQIFMEMNLKPEDRILEIGCGWGACASRAAKLHGCQWTGLTISKEQLKTAQKRISDLELQDRVDFKLLDYRLEKGVYDKVIAIEMIEAVGHEFLPQFFDTLHDRLNPGGRAFIQAITCPEAYYERYRRSSDFIKKHIFPGGHLPSERAIHEALHPELVITKTTHIGQHYVPTLDLWYCAWMEHEKDVMELGYSRQFHRKWQFYFALCSTLFKYSHIDTVQMLIERTK